MNTTTFYFVAMIVVIVAGTLWMLRGKRAEVARPLKPVTPRPSAGSILDRVGLSRRSLNPARVQAVSRTAILDAARTSTIYSRTLSLAPMVVAVSPEAYQVIRPVMRRLAEELETHIPEEAARDGYADVVGTLSITFEADPGLAGDMVRVQVTDAPVPAPGPVRQADGQRATPRAPQRAAQVPPAGRVTQAVPAPGQPVGEGAGPTAALWDITGRSGPSIMLQFGHEYTLGASAASDVRIDRPDISGIHAAVRFGLDPRTRKPVLLVRDIDSTNGTTVDGRPIDQNGTSAGHGAVIGLAASTKLRVTIGHAHARVTGLMGAEA